MRRCEPRPVLALFALLLVGLLALPAWGQATDSSPDTPASSPESTGEIFFDSVDVNVVNVEVFVTDRKDRPVLGLTQDDFLLFEDKEPVEISNFLAVENGVESTDEDEAVAPETEVAEEGGGAQSLVRPREQLPPDQRLHVVIFVDNLNIRPSNRNQVLGHLRRFLRESLDNQDRVMLVSFDGSLDIRQELTSIPELVQVAIDDLEKETGRGMDVERERQLLLRQIEEVGIDGDSINRGTAEIYAQQALEGIRIHASGIRNRTRFTLKAMESIVDSLAGLSGRKAMLYVSGGMPMLPGQALFEAWRSKFSSVPNLTGMVAGAAETLSYDSTADFQDLIAKANANRVVLYTLDAGGASNFSVVDASQGGFDLGAMGTASGGRIWGSDLQTIEQSGLRQTFQLLSDSTGGLSFINTRGLSKTLNHLASDFESYYSLGYRPDREADGKYHRLEVRLKEPGKYKIRHRLGYQAKDSDDRMSDRTLSALLLNASDNPLGVELERAAGSKESGDIYAVPMLIKIPLGELALLPDQEYHRGRLSVFIAVRNEKGGSSPVARVPMPIDIPNDQINQALGQYAAYEFTLRMKEGFQRVAVGVRDEVASVSSTLRLNFRVGE
ncbi:MAG: VWA domain-containing protein [Acidobacteriota bacterium]|nr:VWA domain-containing protein [Acidobacteriota bacterium]